jgi:hypothetical protein
MNQGKIRLEAKDLVMSLGRSRSGSIESLGRKSPGLLCAVCFPVEQITCIATRALLGPAQREEDPAAHVDKNPRLSADPEEITG